ncbi:hypothetical protein M426DRAFT_25069 [Hypoxylon sp. CI-4A]|nr:hypothetical protein M426DRAFT_25069 [Hypoxylon sp. CI-4A]
MTSPFYAEWQSAHDGGSDINANSFSATVETTTAPLAQYVYLPDVNPMDGWYTPLATPSALLLANMSFPQSDYTSFSHTDQGADLYLYQHPPSPSPGEQSQQQQQQQVSSTTASASKEEAAAMNTKKSDERRQTVAAEDSTLDEFWYEDNRSWDNVRPSEEDIPERTTGLAAMATAPECYTCGTPVDYDVLVPMFWIPGI